MINVEKALEKRQNGGTGKRYKTVPTKTVRPRNLTQQRHGWQIRETSWERPTLGDEGMELLRKKKRGQEDAPRQLDLRGQAQGSGQSQEKTEPEARCTGRGMR